MRRGGIDIDTEQTERYPERYREFGWKMLDCCGYTHLFDARVIWTTYLRSGIKRVHIVFYLIDVYRKGAILVSPERDRLRSGFLIDAMPLGGMVEEER